MHVVAAVLSALLVAAVVDAARVSPAVPPPPSGSAARDPSNFTLFAHTDRAWPYNSTVTFYAALQAQSSSHADGALWRSAAANATFYWTFNDSATAEGDVVTHRFDALPPDAPANRSYCANVTAVFLSDGNNVTANVSTIVCASYYALSNTTKVLPSNVSVLQCPEGGTPAMVLANTSAVDIARCACLRLCEQHSGFVGVALCAQG